MSGQEASSPFWLRDLIEFQARLHHPSLCTSILDSSPNLASLDPSDVPKD